MIQLERLLMLLLLVQNKLSAGKLRELMLDRLGNLRLWKSTDLLALIRLQKNLLWWMILRQLSKVGTVQVNNLLLRLLSLVVHSTYDEVLTIKDASCVIIYPTGLLGIWNKLRRHLLLVIN